MKKMLLVLLTVGLVNVTMAETLKTTEQVPAKPLIELGVSLGTPAGINLSAGVWGTSEVPFLVRASGMYFGDRIRGVQGDVGILFTPESTFKNYVALSAVKTDGTDLEWQGIGPAYGFNWHGLSAQVGLSFGSGRTDVFRNLSGPQLMAQLGYSFLF